MVLRVAVAVAVDLLLLMVADPAEQEVVEHK
jgi:hypothetical protein